MPDDSSPEDELADQLAAAHEAILEGRDIAAAEQQKKSNLGSGVEVLKLIELVRHKEQSAPSNVRADVVESSLGEFTVPQALGRYEIVRLLGEGSHGLVYLAIDTQLGREVALKVPRVDVLVSSDLRNRFLMEAKAAAALSHPNIVPVFESGNVGNVCFISYAYCEGKPLSEWIDHWRTTEQPLPSKLIARLMASLADAVQYAHSRGVVHRDLKPSNLLIPMPSVSPNEETVRDVQILDFGLAKSTDNDNQLTKTGAIIGTPAYMSPEQALGSGSEVRPATDVYSLGAVLYELLCLRMPFDASSTLETLEAVRTQDPVPPNRILRGVSTDLEAICLKCLEKKPQERYSTAAQLRDDLERFLRNEPVNAKPISMWQYTRRWIERYPLVAGLSIALISTLVVATVSLAMLSFQLKAAADRSRVAEREAKELVAELSTNLASRTQDDLISAWTKVIESGEATAHSYFERGNCYWQKAEFASAIADLEEALALDSKHLWANDYLAWILMAGPVEYRDLERAQLYCEVISGQLDSSWALLVTAGCLEYRLGNYSRSTELLNRSAEKHGNQGTSSIQFLLSMATYKLGDPETALNHYQIALRKSGDQGTNSTVEIDLLQQEAQSLLGLSE